jgi:hypothetical protein
MAGVIAVTQISKHEKSIKTAFEEKLANLVPKMSFEL